MTGLLVVILSLQTIRAPMSKWQTGRYLGSITVNKVELKYTLNLTFKGSGMRSSPVARR